MNKSCSNANSGVDVLHGSHWDDDAGCGYDGFDDDRAHARVRGRVDDESSGLDGANAKDGNSC